MNVDIFARLFNAVKVPHLSKVPIGVGQAYQDVSYYLAVWVAEFDLFEI